MTGVDLGEMCETIHGEADSLAPTFTEFEEICLNAGARLGEATPGLSTLASQFEEVSALLDGPAILTATKDLEAIASEIERAAKLVEDESRALPELVSINQAVGEQIVGLLSFIRTVAALVFTLKIESAQLKEETQEMVAFAEALQRTADQARQSLDEYHATHTRLDATLKAAAATSLEYQREQQEALSSIAVEIVDSLGAVSDRRRRTVAALHDVSSLATAVGGRISQCLAALQIGDSTRQRVEHVCDALHLAASALGGDSLRLGSRVLKGEIPDRQRLAARILRLQTLQIDSARHDFLRDAATISLSLSALGEQTHELESRGVGLFGGKDADDGSFLEQLERKLSAARKLVEGCLTARANVDRATSSVVATMSVLDARTGALLEIAAEVTMIGVNASLKSARLGDAGKGIMLVAQELRSFGDRIRRTIDELPAALKRVVTFVDRFAEARRELDAARLAQLDSRMVAAIQTFSESGRQMSTALSRLSDEARQVRERLDRASGALVAHESAGPKLENTIVALEPIVDGLGVASAHSAALDALLDAWLRPVYSMTSERQVHDRLTGFVAPESETAGMAAAESAGDLADAFML